MDAATPNKPNATLTGTDTQEAVVPFHQTFDERPLYLQVEEQILQMIRQEGLGVGDVIPGRNILCQTFSVSDLTVRKAVNHLVQQGVLVTSQGRGTRIATDPNISKILFVCGVNIFGSDLSAFYTNFLSACEKEISKHGMTLKPIWLSGERANDAYMYCNSKFLRGYQGAMFIGCPLSHPLYQYVVNEKFDHVIVTHEQADSRQVTANYDDAIVKAVRYLHDEGHEKVSLVCNTNLLSKANQFVQNGGELHRIVELKSMTRSAECETEGYHFMRSLIARGDNDQSAMVFLDNVTARGASRAVLKAGQTHKSNWVVFSGLQEIVPLGFPVAYILFDTDCKAKESVRILMQQIKGQSGQPDFYIEQPRLVLSEDLDHGLDSDVEAARYTVHPCGV